MSVTSATVITAAKVLAQDPGGSTKLLLADGDYLTAVLQGVDEFKGDRPNIRVSHVTIATTGFRVVLKGAGAVLPTSGVDRWVDGASVMRAVWPNYLTTRQDNTPLDQNDWRVRPEPAGLVVLELLRTTVAVGEVLRLEYSAPHTLHASDPAQSSILEGDVTAFEILTAAIICEMTARRYVQNTGTSTFQNESVDRRTQSDVMSARAKDLRKQYGALVGESGDGGVAGYSTTKKMVIEPTHQRGRLWLH